MGSSRNLGQRVRTYPKPSLKDTSRFRRDFHKLGFDKFKLTLVMIPDTLYRPNLEIALEQYYFFTLVPGYNDIPVAGSGGNTTFTEESRIKKISEKGQPVYL